MTIKVSLPNNYDNIRIEGDVPPTFLKQCTIEPPFDTSLSFRVIADGRINEEMRNITEYCLMHGKSFAIPMKVEAEPRVVDVLMEYYKGIDQNLEIVENIKVPVHTTGTAWTPIGEPTSADSLFLRMGLYDPSMMEVLRKNDDIAGLKGFKDDVFDPESVDIKRAAHYILRFLSDYKEAEPVFKDGLVHVSTLTDVLNAEKGSPVNPITKGLLFCHIAQKLNYSPIMAIVGKKCIVGLKTCSMDLESTSLTDKKNEIDFGTDGSASTYNPDGKYILFDMSVLDDVESSVDSARSVWDTLKPDVLCSVRYELGKIAMLKMEL